MMTVFSLCVVMGPIIGPVFGGALAETLIGAGAFMSCTNLYSWLFY